MPKPDNTDRHPGGRPVSYNQTKKWAEWIEEWKTATVDTTDDHGRIKVQLPTLESLSLFLEAKLRRHTSIKINTFCIDTIENYAKDPENKPEFFGALRYIKQEQKKRLLESGLSGTYNSTIAKLILSANHGMNEKSEVEQTHKFSKMPTIVKDGEKTTFNVGEEIPKK